MMKHTHATDTTDAMDARARRTITIVLVVLLVLAGAARATQIQDLVTLKGSEGNTLIGMGLVVGLKGTGDGGKFAPAMRPLANAIGALIDDTVVAAELKDARNVAMVAITAQLPGAGVRDGQLVDVQVASIGAAKSLEGGRLLIAPLIHHRSDPTPMAFAQGQVVIEDAEHPNTGKVVKGAQLTRDVWNQFYDRYYRITLLLRDEVASWPVAHAVASHVNDELSPDGPDIAKALDPKNVIISVPIYERENPSGFIDRILTSYIDPALINTGARVVINEKTGTIVLTGDVRISPVVIMHRGLTITTVTPQLPPSVQAPRVQEDQYLLMDPDRRANPELINLLTALNQLKVDAGDQIAIIREINESGKLHAQLSFDQ